MLTNLTEKTLAFLREAVPLWPDIKSALRLRGSITGSGAARVSSGPGGVVVHVDPAAKVDTPVAGARPFICIITGKESGANTYKCDAFDLPRTSLDASSAVVDHGTKIFEGAIFKDLYKSGDLWPDDEGRRTKVIMFAFQAGVAGTDSRPVFCGFPFAFGGCDTKSGSGG